MSFSEFQNAPKKLSPQDVGFIVFVAVTLLLLFGVNYVLSSALPPSGEFSLLRTAGRAFLFDGIEPYGIDVPLRVQEEVYGRSARSGEQPYILDVPFHLLIPYFVFALDGGVFARALFFSLLEIALFLAAYAGLNLPRWEPPRLHLLLFFVVSLLNYYSINAFLSGSPAIFLLLALAGILMSLKFGRDELAGAFLSLICFQWEITAPFFILIIFYVFRSRRWQVLVGFGMLTFVLLAASYLWYPGWTIPYLRASYNNLLADFGYSTHRILNDLFPAYANQIGWALTGAVAVLLGFEWSKVDEKDFRRFYWTSCLTLAVTPLLGFRLQLEQLVILILPLGFLLEVISDRWSRAGDILTFSFMLAFFVIPWAASIQGAGQLDRVNEILFVSLPLFTIVCLYWIRWWAIHLPRTWLDQAGGAK